MTTDGDDEAPTMGTVMSQCNRTLYTTMTTLTINNDSPPRMMLDMAIILPLVGLNSIPQ
jgi:hypothetical protein